MIPEFYSITLPLVATILGMALWSYLRSARPSPRCRVQDVLDDHERRIVALEERTSPLARAGR
jgi:hypothetical protein